MDGADAGRPRAQKRCVTPVPVGGACSELEQCEELACIDGTCREPVAAEIPQRSGREKLGEIRETELLLKRFA